MNDETIDDRNRLEWWTKLTNFKVLVIAWLPILLPLIIYGIFKAIGYMSNKDFSLDTIGIVAFTLMSMVCMDRLRDLQLLQRLAKIEAKNANNNPAQKGCP